MYEESSGFWADPDHKSTDMVAFRRHWSFTPICSGFSPIRCTTTSPSSSCCSWTTLKGPSSWWVGPGRKWKGSGNARRDPTRSDSSANNWCADKQPMNEEDEWQMAEGKVENIYIFEPAQKCVILPKMYKINRSDGNFICSTCSSDPWVSLIDLGPSFPSDRSD